MVKKLRRQKPPSGIQHKAAKHMASLIADLGQIYMKYPMEEREEEEERTWLSMLLTKYGFRFSREETLWFDLAFDNTQEHRIFTLIAESLPDWEYEDADLAYVEWTYAPGKMWRDPESMDFDLDYET